MKTLLFSEADLKTLSADGLEVTHYFVDPPTEVYVNFGGEKEDGRVVTFDNLLALHKQIREDLAGGSSIVHGSETAVGIPDALDFEDGFEVPEEILTEAEKRVARLLEHKLWYWDEWFELDPEWDLNIYAEEEEIFATLYPVSNGHTDTGRWHPLLHLRIEGDLRVHFTMGGA